MATWQHGDKATWRFAGASVATIPSSRECTREHSAPYFHDDGNWQSGVMRRKGIDVFIRQATRRGRLFATRRRATRRLMPAMVLRWSATGMRARTRCR